MIWIFAANMGVVELCWIRRLFQAFILQILTRSSLLNVRSKGVNQSFKGFYFLAKCLCTCSDGKHNVKLRLPIVIERIKLSRWHVREGALTFTTFTLTKILFIWRLNSEKVPIEFNEHVSADVMGTPKAAHFTSKKFQKVQSSIKSDDGPSGKG